MKYIWQSGRDSSVAKAFALCDGGKQKQKPEHSSTRLSWQREEAEQGADPWGFPDKQLSLPGESQASPVKNKGEQKKRKIVPKKDTQGWPLTATHVHLNIHSFMHVYACTLIKYKWKIKSRMVDWMLTLKIIAQVTLGNHDPSDKLEIREVRCFI